MAADQKPMGAAAVAEGLEETRDAGPPTRRR
jgi:hypothetical protein